MGYLDLNSIHNPATDTSPPATWGDQVRDNDEYLNSRGPFICTSSTRPGAPFDGQQIYETDTNRSMIYNGSAWTGMKSVMASSLVGVALSGITAYATYNTLALPAQGCAGVWLLYTLVRLDATVNTDVAQVKFITSAGTLGGTNYAQASGTAGVKTGQLQVMLTVSATDAPTVQAQMARDSGTGSFSCFVGGTAPNYITALFIPTA